MLLDLGSEINVIHPIFAKALELSIRPIDIGVQKIESTILNIYKIVITACLITDKSN